MGSKSRYVLLIVAILVLTACAPPKATQSPTTTQETKQEANVEISEKTTPQPEDTPYPPPPVVEVSDTDPYPPPTIEILPVDAYPAPESSIAIIGDSAFQFNKPIHEGATEITGVGPAGVPILILDITFMGEILGEGLIDDNGTFTINVEPLEKAHRIGISLDNLEGTQWTQEDFYGIEFNGEGAMQVPMVGYFYDTIIVTEK